MGFLGGEGAGGDEVAADYGGLQGFAASEELLGGGGGGEVGGREGSALGWVYFVPGAFCPDEFVHRDGEVLRNAG